MKFGELITALEKFFNDILGSIIPGGLFLIGLWFIGALAWLGLSDLKVSDVGTLFVLVVIAYLLGHVLDEVNRRCFSYVGKDNEKGEEDRSYHIFRVWVEKQFTSVPARAADGGDGGAATPPLVNPADWQDLTESDLRSVAMTLSDDAEKLSRRFKFIELCCRGTATALVVVAALAALKLLVQLGCQDPMELKLLLLVLATIGIVPFLYLRANVFRGRSDTVCFDCAVAYLLEKK